MKFLQFSQTKLGSSFVSLAYGWSGTRATINYNRPVAEKKSGAARKQAGKKKKGCGENEFLPACQSAESGQWGGSVSAIPASAGRQNRKIFVSLIEKSFGGRAKLKIVEKMFLLGLRAKRAAAERSVKIRNPDFRQKKFGFRPTNTTILN